MPSIWSGASSAGCASGRWKDSDLCRAVAEMSLGLIDASLGSGLLKKRIARHGAGKSGGYRVLVAYRGGGPWFFIEGYAKGALSDVPPKRLRAVRDLAGMLLDMTDDQLSDDLRVGLLKEVRCDA
ncbi:type II toxin-antitoxin system RelE/ParE family toxin [Roseateles chitinivorans]|uniref:type II toxin-antitoxin system RelE/ParE family toxin n=1 Tax=Roseateles chitinivorans TaxID=2917965 RepID=UPI003D66C87D